MIKSNSTDRLGFTLVISVIIHLIVLLGVSFNIFSPPTNAPINNLEITLIQQKDNTRPEEADFLAQANNEGGGEFETPTPTPSADKQTPLIKDEAAAPQPSSTSQAQTEIDTMSNRDAAATPTPVSQPTLQPTKTNDQATQQTDPVIKKPAIKPAETKVKAITQAESDRKVQVVEAPGEAVEVETKPQRQLSAKELMLKARSEIEQLEKKFDESAKSLSDRPKKRRISASTKEYAAAAYMKAWELKVERIGNMNYPQAAKQAGLNGSLMLSVDINPDGSVPPGGIVISRSSGHKVLDDAAVKIVRLGAPYAAIPDDVLKTNDMLTIIRTWKFETNQGLSTR